MTKIKKEHDYIWLFAALAIIFILGVMGLTYYSLRNNDDTRGTFGDMFGAANALFTGLSFVGLIVTILLQRKDLNIQREELKEQTNLVQKQNFESTFFQLLSMFNSIVATMEVEYDDNTYKGRNAFIAMNDTLNAMIIEKARGGKAMLPARLEEAIKNLYKGEVMTVYIDFYDSHKEYISHYFRAFYHIIKYIHITDNIDKQFYISIARSQLSSAELILLFYNGISPRGSRKFRPLIVKYDVLQGIDYSLMLNTSLKSEYEIIFQNN